MTTPIERAIKLRGLTALAHAIGATPNQLNNWRTRGVPVEYARAIEDETNGEVTRKELVPEDWERLWPELKNQ